MEQALILTPDPRSLSSGDWRLITIHHSPATDIHYLILISKKRLTIGGRVIIRPIPTRGFSPKMQEKASISEPPRQLNLWPLPAELN
jgi:hypothetical protein